MNKGTIGRIAAAIVSFLAGVICMFDILELPIWVKGIIALALLISGVVCTYYNNDFTEAAAIGTGITRQIKAEMDPDYVGERFFDIPEEELILVNDEEGDEVYE